MTDEELDTLNQAIAERDGVTIRRWFVERGHPQIGYDEVTVLLDIDAILHRVGVRLEVQRKKPIEEHGGECRSDTGQRESSSSSGTELTSSRVS